MRFSSHRRLGNTRHKKKQLVESENDQFFVKQHGVHQMHNMYQLHVKKVFGLQILKIIDWWGELACAFEYKHLKVLSLNPICTGAKRAKKWHTQPIVKCWLCEISFVTQMDIRMLKNTLH